MIMVLSIMVNLAGLMLIVFSGMLGYRGSLSIGQTLIIQIGGWIATFMSIFLLVYRANSTGASKIIDLPRPGRYLILMNNRGGESSFMYGHRYPQAHIGIRGMGLFKDTGRDPRTLGGHPFRQMWETVGITIDPEISEAVNLFLARYGVNDYIEAMDLYDLIVANYDLSDKDLAYKIRAAGFNPDPVLADRKFTVALGGLVDQYFQIKEDYNKTFNQFETGSQVEIRIKDAMEEGG